MPLLTSVRRALLAALLSTTFASAQTCWYPDGTTVSTDVPCNVNATASSCCSSQSFCLEGGLCLTGGLTTRGSCTDQTWSSEECADFCKTVDSNGEIGITPCTAGVSTNTFVCGLDNTQCNDISKTFTLPSNAGLILRPAQIEALLKDALASGATAPSSSTSGTFTTGTLAGTAAGIAIPLLIAIGIISWLYARERRRNLGRRVMYRLPDNETKESLTIHPPPSLFNGVSSSSGRDSRPSHPPSHAGSDVGSVRSYSSAPTTPQPSQMHMGAELQRPMQVHGPKPSYAESQRLSNIASLAERIESMKSSPQLIDVRDSTSSRHELDSSPPTPRKNLPLSRFGSTERYPMSRGEVERYELASSRMSR